MVNVRRPAQLDMSGSSSRKRARADDHDEDDDLPSLSMPKRGDREQSPGKSVHFGRRLESGPTTSRADHRNQSPRRPALHKPDEQPRRRFSLGSLFGFGSPQPSETTGNLGTETDDESDADSYPDSSEDVQDDIDAQLLDSAPTTSHERIGQQTGNLDPDLSFPGRAEQLQARTRIQPRPHPFLSRHLTSGDLRLPDVAGLATEEARDLAVSQALHRLRDMVLILCSHFTGPLPRNLDVLSALFSHSLDKNSTEQLVRYIGSLAMGGPKGRAGWVELVIESAARRALVTGIVGRALKEVVFGSLWFGATEQQESKLSDMEQAAIEKDGFERTKDRARRCRDLARLGNLAECTQALQKAKAKVVVQLDALLRPLYSLAPSASPSAAITADLAIIVSYAADLSRLMRQMDDVVYYWPPTFKDEEFEPARMECINLQRMIDTSPYEKKIVNGRERAVLQDGRAHIDEAIVRVVGFPGCVAYRKGGGDLAVKTLQAEGRKPDHAPADVQEARRRYASRDHVDEHSGFRTKVIMKAVVCLQWGKQRLLTREAGTSVYLDAVRDGSGKYDEDYKGFVELWDLYTEQSKRPVFGKTKKLEEVQPLKKGRNEVEFADHNVEDDWSS